jgi:hypothetical protein
MDIHTSFELFLFLSLFLGKVGASPRLIKAVIFVGMVIYGLSRITQTVLITVLLVVTAPRMNESPYFTFICTLFVLFTLVQSYTFVFYHRFYVQVSRLAANPRPQNKFIRVRNPFRKARAY